MIDKIPTQHNTNTAPKAQTLNKRNETQNIMCSSILQPLDHQFNILIGLYLDVNFFSHIKKVMYSLLRKRSRENLITNITPEVMIRATKETFYIFKAKV